MMEDNMFKFAGIAAALFATAITAPAGAQSPASPAAPAARAQIELVAATSTTHKSKRATKPGPVQVASPRPVWNGPDPTKGPGIERLRAEQRAGRCVIDEGYGRFSYCSDR
jgi:hypothetical protein